MKKIFSIGEVSKIKGITIKALRYYHKMGILIPKYIDEYSGYRHYSIDQFVYIDIIKGCRLLGISIKELQEIFQRCDTDELLEFLEIKKHEAKENINKMNKVIENIDTLKTSIKLSKEIVYKNEIAIKYFETRYIIVLPCKEVGSLNELLYYSDLDKLILEKNINVSVQRGIIYKINDNISPESKYVFNIIEEYKDIKNDESIKILPKGRYLTMVYDTENKEQCIKKISDYIKENNIRIDDIIEFDLYNDIFNTKNYNSQIQIFLGNYEVNYEGL
ncbi:MerR family transcriptional regulator [Romboutsia sp. Marseille-P6047]|uniref:MerR family transcriptional regulator n=1 Tax=Romboutsia sp. Marseille-P6047 TaxID=2161817 RepID=UPI000F045E18|nr:helix-turn-helix domain-containing protein [Romboutsia sp. Marseille-P6047]